MASRRKRKLARRKPTMYYTSRSHNKIVSQEDKFNLAGKSLKEWAFIILMINLSVVIGSYAVVFWLAVANDPSAITITGAIDISQITIIVFGIAMVATVLVSQKLTKDAVTEAVANTDKVWQDEK